jgi:hypothetical protein
MVPSPKLSHTARSFLLLIPAILLFAVLVGWQIWRLSEATKPMLQSNGVPINVEIEERFGVRFTGVHVVGKSGLVDLRYRVLDVGKAKNFGHYTETSPMLISEGNGKTVEVTIMGLHNHRVEAGRSYYILYRNTDNALKPGNKVTLQIDNLTLEHIPVQ